MKNMKRTVAHLAGLTVGAVLVALAGAWVSAPQAHGAPAHHVVIGASGGSAIDELRSHVGGKLASHVFDKLSDSPDASPRYIDLEPGAKWASVAAGEHDDWLASWAAAVKAKGKLTYLTFSHEPMTSKNAGFGVAPEFIAAWRHVVGYFRAAGVTNVRWVWNITWHSIEMDPPSSDAYYTKWWPGRKWVDDVAAEDYNRYTCGDGTWWPFKVKAAQILAVAQSYGKPVVFAEFASQSDVNRAHWLTAAQRWLTLHRDSVDGAYYFQSTHSSAPGCSWKLTTQPEYDAFKALIEGVNP